MDGAFREIDENEEIDSDFARSVTCGSSTKNSNAKSIRGDFLRRRSVRPATYCRRQKRRMRGSAEFAEENHAGATRRKVDQMNRLSDESRRRQNHSGQFPGTVTKIALKKNRRKVFLSSASSKSATGGFFDGYSR